nr:hypothetical protein [Lachnospiraceae bacterium]
DVISRDCDKCAYYVDGANDEACDGCFADEYEHPNFKPKAQHYEDCISRQVVDELSKELVHTTRDKADFLCNFWEGLQKLPPVTPKEKTAAWVGIDQEPHEVYECNACGWLLYDEDRTDFKYCPNCGAKMVEPQESEG